MNVGEAVKGIERVKKPGTVLIIRGGRTSERFLRQLKMAEIKNLMEIIMEGTISNITYYTSPDETMLFLKKRELIGIYPVSCILHNHDNTFLDYGKVAAERMTKTFNKVCKGGDKIMLPRILENFQVGDRVNFQAYQTVKMDFLSYLFGHTGTYPFFIHDTLHPHYINIASRSGLNIPFKEVEKRFFEKQES